MTTTHRHAEILRAIADGNVVQYQTPTGGAWMDFQPDIHVFPTNDRHLVWRVKPEEIVDYTVVLVEGRPGAVFTSTISELPHYYTANNYQGYMKRTLLDGKVVSFEFISK